MINPGELRHRIKIPGTPTEIENEVGETILVPGESKTIWAKVIAVKGKEAIEAQKIRPELTYRVTIRYREGIDSSMIIEWEGRKLELITPPYDLDGKKAYMGFMCIEKVK